jgi:hypothetical protein
LGKCGDGVFVSDVGIGKVEIEGNLRLGGENHGSLKTSDEIDENHSNSLRILFFLNEN